VAIFHLQQAFSPERAQRNLLDLLPTF